MRILLVSTYYPPQPAVASLRVHAHATAWAESGAEVTVLTTQKRDDQRGAEIPSPGVRVVEVPVPTRMVGELLRGYAGRRGVRSGASTQDAGARPGLFARALGRFREGTGVFASVRMPDLTDAWVAPAVARARELARGGAFDAVVASSGPYTTLLAARRIRRAGLASRFVAEFRDLWTANHMASGCFPFTLRERALELAVLREADLVVTVSEPLAAWLRPRARGPVEVVFNGHAGRRPAGAALAAGVRTLVYTGTVYPRGHDLGPLMRGLALLRRENPDSAGRVRVIVAGPAGEHWRTAAAAHGVLDLIDLRGPVPHAEALALQDGASALLSLEWTGPEEGVLTAKLFEYLAGAAPIMVVGPRRTITEWAERLGRGLNAGSDGEEVARSLHRLARGEFAPTGVCDFGSIEALSRRAQSARMLGLIRQTVSPGVGPTR